MSYPNQRQDGQDMPKFPMRPIRIEGHLAYVPLSKGYEAVIDATDVHLVGAWNWCALVTPRAVYAKRTDRSGPKQRTVLMHRVLMGDPDDLEVDHRDGNGLHNMRDNLRTATRPQNQHNQRLAKHNTSGLKGVNLHKKTGKWQAYIKMHGKSYHLGLFVTQEAAHDAYVAASNRLHGTFGRAE